MILERIIGFLLIHPIFGIIKLIKILVVSIVPWDNRQKDIIRDITSSKGTRRKRILGPSGSGKTFVIATSVAVILEKNPYAKILITYYNKSLQMKIISELQKFDLFSNPSDMIYKNNKVASIKSGNIPSPFLIHVDLFLYHANKKLFSFFDYIFVDEGQDFSPIKIKNLLSFLSPSGKICFFADKRQRIYDYNDFTKQDDEHPNDFVPSLPEKCGFVGRWAELSHLYRNPGIIGQLAEKYALSVLSKKYGPSNIIETLDDADIINEQNIYLVVDEMYSDQLFEYIKYFISKYDWDINKTAILFSVNSDVAAAYRYFSQFYDIHCTYDGVRDPDDLKMSFSVDIPALKISTIHSFKGLEIDNVIFVHTSWEYMNQPDLELNYIGLSRATKQLLIIDLENSSDLKDIYKSYLLSVPSRFVAKVLPITYS